MGVRARQAAGIRMAMATWVRGHVTCVAMGVPRAWACACSWAYGRVQRLFAHARVAQLLLVVVLLRLAFVPHERGVVPQRKVAVGGPQAKQELMPLLEAPSAPQRSDVSI